MPLPAVLTIQSGINQLRYATLKGIMAAKKKEIRKVAAAGGRGAAAEDRRASTCPRRRKKTQLIAGSPAEAAEGAVRRLREEARVDRMILGRSPNSATASSIARRGRRSPRAQQLAATAATGAPITVARARGAASHGVAAELAAAQVQEVVTVEHAALEPYTPDGYTAALQAAIAQLSPSLVLLPHTYQTRDFAPKLAARLDRALITDVTASRRVATRPRSCGRCSRAS